MAKEIRFRVRDRSGNLGEQYVWDLNEHESIDLLKWTEVIRKLQELTGKSRREFRLFWYDGFHYCLIADSSDLDMALAWLSSHPPLVKSASKSSNTVESINLFLQWHHQQEAPQSQPPPSRQANIGLRDWTLPPPLNSLGRQHPPSIRPGSLPPPYTE